MVYMQNGPYSSLLNKAHIYQHRRIVRISNREERAKTPCVVSWNFRQARGRTIATSHVVKTLARNFRPHVYMHRFFVVVKNHVLAAFSSKQNAGEVFLLVYIICL